MQFKVDGQNARRRGDWEPVHVRLGHPRAGAERSARVTAVARDSAGQTTTSTPVTVTVFNTERLDDRARRLLLSRRRQRTRSHADSSGDHPDGTSVNSASWTGSARFGGALTLDGEREGNVDLPALGTFYRTGFTYEAWVRKQTASDVAVMGTGTGAAR